jgi:hypothetical protein
MVQASSLIGSNRAFDAQALDFFLKEGVQPLGPPIGTAAARIALRPLIDADKNVMSEGGHEPDLMPS